MISCFFALFLLFLKTTTNKNLNGFVTGVSDIHVDVSDANDIRFVDEFNRERIFHGTNIVLKGHPYIPQEDEFNLNDVMLLKQYGMNIVRLGVFWAGVFPTISSREVNESYIKEVQRVVDMLGKNDIFVLLDAHQDVLNERFCGAGIPDLEGAFKTFPKPLAKKPYEIDNSTGTPSTEDCARISWPTYYFTNDVGKAFESLYTDSPPLNLRSKFERFWEVIAERFASSRNVIGYNLLNEPFAGHILKNLSLAFPWNANRRLQDSFFSNIAKKIRKYDDKKIIFWDGVTWTDPTNFEHVGWTTVPGGDDYRNRSALSIHFYKAVNTDKPYKYFSKYRNITKKISSGLFLTEFWARPGNLSSETTSEKQIIRLLNEADTLKISWAGWQYKCFKVRFPTSDECDGSDESADPLVFLKLNSRVYPFAVAGKIIHFQFDKEKAVFELSYQVGDGRINETSIFVGIEDPTFIKRLEFFISKKREEECELDMQLVKNKTVLLIFHAPSCPKDTIVNIKV